MSDLKITFRFVWIMLLFLQSKGAHCQMAYVGLLSSVTLTDNREETPSTWVLTGGGVVDSDPAVPATGYSYVAAGAAGSIQFVTGTDVSGISSITLSYNSNVYVVPVWAYPQYYYLTFVMPAPLPRGMGITFTIPNVVNPPFKSSCGSNPNSYHDGTAGACGEMVYASLTNATGDVNYYHHFNIPRFTIAPRNYFIRSVTAEKPNLWPASVGTTDNEMLVLDVRVGGSMGPLPQLNAMQISTAGSTATSNITQAGIWHTGSLKYFHAPGESQIFSIASPGAAFGPSGLSLQLQKPYNFFWVEYDLLCSGGALGHVLNANAVSVTIDGLVYNPVTPAGTRTIVQYYPATSANLVNNPGFETYSACPTTWTQPTTNSIALSTGWAALNWPLSGTPDYYNACNPGPVSVPNNTLGSQAAHGGNAYIGLGFDSRNYNHYEYVKTQLSATLQQDTVYYVSMWVTSADFLGGRRIFKSDNIGAWFSATNPTATDASALTATPQFLYTEVLYDQQDWVHVFGTFTATGTENWLVIGGFSLPQTWDTVATYAYTPSNLSGSWAYAYVDDVTVCKLSQAVPACVSLPLSSHQVMLEGEVTGQGNQLEWQLISGQRWSQTELQYATAGEVFRTVAQWEGNQLAGQFLHEVQGQSSSLYRLKLVDENGDASFSEVVRLFPAQEVVVNYAGNGDLIIEGAGEGWEFELTSLSGVNLQQGKLIEGKVECGEVAAGVYLLTLKSGAEIMKRCRVVFR